MPVPEVILVVSGHPARRDGLIAAGRQLAALTGGAHVRLLDLPQISGAQISGAQISGPSGPPDSDASDHAMLAADADIAAAVAARGSRADLVVVAQPEPRDDKPTRLAFHAALLQSERPVLIVPPGASEAAFGRRVAIAWRDDARAVRAVIPALRLLAGAEEVALLAGVRPGTPTPAPPAVLVEHGVHATLHILAIGSLPFGQVLLDAAREMHADLLVMGAYAHTPLREMLLGGVTRYIIGHAHLPVLMRH